MPTAERAGFVERACSTCGKDMVFVGVIDKVTKEWRPLEGMPLSGTLRKYRCQYCGNVETNEEDGLENKFQILDENDPFRKAVDLVGYAEMRAKTERALMRFDHLVCLAYIAGWETGDITPESFTGGKKRFKSLHSYPDLVVDAKRRLDAGDIPKDWLYQFTKEIEDRG